MSRKKWANLKTLVIDPTIREQNLRQPVVLADATDIYKPFSHEMVANTLARATTMSKGLTETLEELTQRRLQKFYVPGAEWMHHVLRPVFADQLPDKDTYEAEFDRAETILGLLAQDAANARAANDSGRARVRQLLLARTRDVSLYAPLRERQPGVGVRAGAVVAGRVLGSFDGRVVWWR